MSKAPHEAEVLDWAYAMVTDEGVNEWTRLACRRYLDDRKDPRWDFRPALPEFCIEMIEGLFTLDQGEDADGRPMRGKPFRLQPWHLFSTYNIAGFYWPGTEIRRFTEAGTFAPRKTVKTKWGVALIWSLALAHRLSGAKAKSVAGSLKQGMEGFDFLTYNMEQLGLIAENNPPGYLVKMDSSLGHSVSGEIWRGYVEFETLAYKPDLFDSFNAQFVHLDELELYKNAIPYARLRDATKAYTNKLILATFTAGDDAVGFAARHHEYLQKILNLVRSNADENVNLIFGHRVDESMKERVSVTIIATGFPPSQKSSSSQYSRPKVDKPNVVSAREWDSMQKAGISSSAAPRVNTQVRSESSGEWGDIEQPAIYRLRGKVPGIRTEGPSYVRRTDQRGPAQDAGGAGLPAAHADAGADRGGQAHPGLRGPQREF